MINIMFLFFVIFTFFACNLNIYIIILKLMENQTEEFGIQNIAYQQLQGQFQQVLSSLSSDPTLDRFRIQYEKIHRALKHSHEQQKRLLGKCRELSKDIIAGSARLQAALRYSNDDTHTISYLKAEVAKTYKYLQLSKQQQDLSKQRIEKLKAELRSLHLMMDQNDSDREGQVAEIQQYTIANEQLQKQKQILQISVQSNQTQLSQIKNKIQLNQNHKQQINKSYKDMLIKKQQQQKKVKDQQENKRSKKDELEVIKLQFDQAKVSQSSNKEKRRDFNIKYKQITAKLHEIQLNIQKSKKILKKLEKQQAIQGKKIQQIGQINGNLSQLGKVKENELNQIEDQLRKSNDKKNNLEQVLAGIKSQINKVIAQREQLQKLKETINSGLIQLETEINNEKKSSSKDRSFIQKLKRDRDMYIKQLERSEANNKKISEEIINREKLLKQKQNQLFGQKKQIQKLNKIMSALEKQRDANSFQATSAEAKYFYSRDQVKLRDNFIAQFQKQNLETEAKLKKQQSLYEAVRSDRNLVSKKLSQIQQQKKQYQKRYVRVIHQISQLKQQIDTKEAQLVKQHNEHKKKDKKIEDEVKKIDKYQKDILDKVDKIKNYENQIKKLQAIIKETEYQKQKLQEEYELVVSQRDILGTQLIRRSAQADLLYEKIKINQSALSKGEAQYTDKLLEIQNEKQQIVNLMNQIKAYKTQNGAITDLKAQIHNLSRELTEAKLKVKALSEQIQNPMNVHRWRKLQATDTAIYELMTKIQSVQKRLIGKTQQVKKREREYEQKQKQLKSLQQILKRQPSIEQQKMIPVYQQNLQQKQRQIEAMKQQIQNHEQIMSQMTIQSERLKKQLQNFKKKFFYQKKKEQQDKEERKTQEDYIKVILPDKRFTGGGFNLAI